MQYPKDALHVVFKTLNGPTVHYRVWKQGGYYYWATKEYGGKEETQEKAMASARQWIALGIAGIRTGRGESCLVRNV